MLIWFKTNEFSFDPTPCVEDKPDLGVAGFDAVRAFAKQVLLLRVHGRSMGFLQVRQFVFRVPLLLC